MSNLTTEEKETVISIDASDRSICYVYSSDPVYQRKLEKIGATVISENDWGKRYELPANQVILSKARKPMTEEQRKESSERMKKFHEEKRRQANNNADV
jgi:hypothetical protein